MSAVEKQYGLVEPKTGKKLSVSDVFNNDSDSGGEQDSKWNKKPSQKEEKGLKKQTKIEMQRALEQDPTVYQYDEVYDEMARKKQEVEQTKVNPEKKPKYIHNLLRTAEKRKKENERRLERQIQKEREAEGDMFKDKEEFITSSYKAKLEEFKKAEEEEKKMEYIESIMDVTKQQDLGGFYRHLYKETVPEQDSESKKEAEGRESQPVEKAEEKSGATTKPERNYRKRHSSDTNDGDEKKSKAESSSSSSDSDSSTDSSSSSSSSEEEKNEEKKEAEAKPNESKSGPEDGEIVETRDKGRKEEERPKPPPKKGNPEPKTEAKEDRTRNASRVPKADDRDRRDRSQRASAYDRDRTRNLSRRDERNYRERERDRERRDDRKARDQGERRSTDSRRRRSRSPEKRRNSRERSSERSRSRRAQERQRDVKEVRSGGNSNHMSSEVEKKRVEGKEVKKEEATEVKEQKEAEERVKASIWEKRTVGAVFEAAVQRYAQRKAARGC